MHIVLTDIVTCPRCGPEFGLIILADRIEERRVREGRLGCANCREEYPVHGGVADLRLTGERPGSSTSGVATAPADAETAFRLAALLGVTGTAPPLLVYGAGPDLVAAMQEVVPDAGFVGMSGEPLDGAGGVGMGWIYHRGSLPFRDRSLGGVALLSGASEDLIHEALRCLARGARLVVDPAADADAERLVAAGAEILLRQEGVAVAFDPRAG